MHKKIFFQKKGLKNISPLYNFLDNKEKITDTLNEFGIEGKQEAICNYADSFSEYPKEEEVRQHIEKTIPIIEKFLEENEIS